MSNGDHLRVIDGEAGRAISKPPPDPRLGRTIDGRYHVEEVLGEGGMGIVYKARHTILNKALAIKVLRPEVGNDDEIITRFRQEAQSASNIGNQHIIDISDFGTLPDGATYFVMEYLNGVDLSTAMAEETPMKAPRAIHIMKQLCVALGAAHEAGIVHRDLKPDNIYLIRRGNDSNFVKVLDFGIAKVGSGTKKLTKAGQVFGTPHYMSPEQCAGTGTDHRTDIYAIGVILYEMVCGRVPFDADNLMGVLTKHMYENPIAPHELPPPVNVPPGLEAVILKCLAKNQDIRYQSMAEVFSDLSKAELGQTPDAVLEAVARSSSPTTGPRMDTGRITMSVGDPGAEGEDLSPPRSKLPLILGAAGVLAVLGVIGLVVALQVGGTEETTPPPEPTPAPIVAEPEPPPVAEPPPNPENVAESGSAETATVMIRSEPDGAEVFRGNELLGNTPLTLRRPDEGDENRVQLTLRLAGHEEQSVTISDLTAENVRITLEQARRGRAGRTGPRAGMREQATAMDPGMEPTMEPVMEAPMVAEPPPAMRPQPTSEVLDPWGA